MSYICVVSGKKVQIGRSQRHKRGVAGKRWRKRAQASRRTFAPNLQKQTLLKDGKKVKVWVATKYLKKLKTGVTINGYAYPQN